MLKSFVVAFSAVFILVSAPALADNDRRDHRQWHHGDAKKHDSKHYKKHDGRHHGKHYAKPGKVAVVWHGNRRWGPPPKRHVSHHVHRHQTVHHYHTYKRHDRDNWAIYAILALQLVDVLNERQQYGHAWAQQQAAAAPLGESIQWSDGGVYGSVMATRDGTDRGGRYCREFQHQVTIGNRLQSAYGTACHQPDGAWEIVS
ncbi:MAG: hypothetical protein ACFCUT_08890 [Kiloniellaceae bacterium]